MRYLIILLVSISVAITGLGTANTLETKLADDEFTEAELYSWLQIEGMRDETVSNREIHKLIVAGLAHDDPEIRHCAMTAIKFHVGYSVNSIIEGRTVKVDRRLQDIPNLYDLLMEMWDKELIKAGGVVPEIVFDVTLIQIEEEFPCLSGKPAWAGLPRTFAYLFPKDEKVYNIVWMALKDKKTLPDKDEDNPIPLLSALYVGEFNHPKDEEFRIQVLTDRTTHYYITALAINSLAKFQSEKSLAALVSTLEQDQHKWGLPYLEIVEAIMSYGDEPTTEFAPLLKKAMSKAYTFEKDKNRILFIEKELSKLDDKIENSELPVDN